MYGLPVRCLQSVTSYRFVAPERRNDFPSAEKLWLSLLFTPYAELDDARGMRSDRVHPAGYRHRRVLARSSALGIAEASIVVQ